MSNPLKTYLLLQLIKENRILRQEIDKNKRKNKRKWSRNFVKVHRTLLNIKKDKQLAITEIKSCLDLSPFDAEQLYHILIPSIENQCKFRKDDVKPKEMLVITFKYLTAKESVLDIAMMYGVEADAVKNVVNKTCRAIFSCLKHYFKWPTDENDWKPIAEQFEKKRKFPNCVGATLLKHVAITEPINDAKEYLNKNGSYSQITYAFVNANHEFFYIETGFKGSFNGDDVFRHSAFLDKILDDCIFLPPPTVVGGIELPYVVVADNSFMVYDEVMVPFLEEELNTDERKMFNERWAYAKRVADDAFELMESKFRIIKRTIDLDVEDANAVVLACAALHNYMIRNISSYKVVEDKTKFVNVTRDEALIADEPYERAISRRDAFVKYFSLESNVTSMETDVAKSEYLESNETKNYCLESNVA